MKLGKKKTKEPAAPEPSKTGLAKWEAFLSQEQVPPSSPEKGSKKGSKTPTLSKKSAEDAKKDSKKEKKDKDPKKDSKKEKKALTDSKKESKRDSKTVEDAAGVEGEEEKIDQKMAQLKALDGWVTSAQTRAAVSLAAANGPAWAEGEEGEGSASGPYSESDEVDGTGSPLPRKVLRRSSAASVADAVVVDMADGRPTLRAGTFQGIVKWLIFQNVGDLSTSFLLTFRAYGTPQELWEALMNVFRIIHEKDLKENARKDMRRRYHSTPPPPHPEQGSHKTQHARISSVFRVGPRP